MTQHIQPIKFFNLNGQGRMLLYQMQIPKGSRWKPLEVNALFFNAAEPYLDMITPFTLQQT